MSDACPNDAANIAQLCTNLQRDRVQHLVPRRDRLMDHPRMGHRELQMGRWTGLHDSSTCTRPLLVMPTMIQQVHQC